MSIRLYNHNQQAYDATVEMLKKRNRACVIHPTGTGKTFIAFKFIEDNQDKRILWLGPSEYIFRMQLRRVGDTDPDLCRYVARNDIFHTYAWLSTNGEYIKNLVPDVIILDEFHRAGAPEWGTNVRRIIEAYPNAKVIGFTATNIRYLDGARDMAVELFDGAIASEMTLIEAMAKGILPVPKYVIATYDYEERLNVIQKRVEVLRSNVVREKNQELLNRLRRNMEQSEGLEKIFSKYIKKRNGKFIVFCTSTEKMYEMIARVVEWFHDIDRLPHVYAVHCYNPESEKEFRDFVEDNSNHTKLLFSIDMLNEGIHVPDVDGVILLRPTDSPIVYKQQIGRALAIDKKSDTVIFDLVNNFEGLNKVHGFAAEYTKMREYYAAKGESVEVAEFEVHDELRDFRELFNVILCNLESSWDMYYDELVRRKEQTGSAYVERRFIAENGLQIGKWLNRQKQKFWEGRLEKDKIEKLQSLGIELRRVNDVRFDRWIELLKEYKEQHDGSTCIPSGFVCETGENLGNWVTNMQRERDVGRLSEDRIHKLDCVGFVWDRYDALWEENYEAAKRYYEEHNNLYVPKRYIDNEGRKLGLWIGSQRRIYFGIVKGNLTDQRIKRLESIGMVWNLKLDKKDTFVRNVGLLQEYVKENGNAYIKADYVTKDGIRLGAWVSYIRAKKQQHQMESMLKPGEKCPARYITIEQEQQLNNIGFRWSERQDKWDVMYELALAYYKEHGKIHGIPNSITDKEGRKLSTWLHVQNLKARNDGKQVTGGKNNGKCGGNLSREQMDKLACIGIPWKKRADIANMRGINEYRNYIAAGGDINIPINYVTVTTYSLGKWCSAQKDKKRQHQLDSNVEQELNRIGFVWNKTEYYWENMYQHAVEYYTTHDGRLPLVDYICDDGAKLGQWVASMRRRIRQNKLSLKDIERLEKVGITGDYLLDWRKQKLDQKDHK